MELQLPRYILIGKNVLPEILEICSDFENPILITDENVRNIFGDKIKKILNRKYKNIDEFIVKNSDLENLSKLEQTITNKKIDLGIAFGGGVVIDTTKKACSNKKIPYISVPTTASNDAICSNRAVIKKGEVPYSTEATAPYAVIADISIIANSPPRLIRAGVGDMIAKMSAISDYLLAGKIKGEKVNEYAISIASKALDTVIKNIDEINKGSEKGIEKLVEALIFSGIAMNIDGSSRPASGSEHEFSHSLDLICAEAGKQPALHGEQCALGTIISLYLHGKDWRKAKRLMKKVGLPTTAKELGYDKETILEALLKSKEMRPERYTIVKHKKIDRKTALKAIEATGIA
ncbi:MAG: sn-glycerol-1-phosphate dehydrogenase [Candidatus Parvarchaeota archaeon]|nr:sn-glycerol-1-phosphate dehydrogenase [Candidatus Jingweiarchaeum tengchongense]MCW1298639.1 sn-glycerol-1-phosphate dehydrogenase [Candidatus Jingweiarchaeum tengchongense]MCW1300481.1 sn-glycerol-1-phosphate dehydrogenase [Candidatus Jingweiarchaeum tengchongense]MCW1304704.1 sn-glycerol-1-phosphate dehydrogenase [Candidatus Jingweiarchaeum tengchongense]MCW1305893.1 sn-glycerol-1-phosphate dehydrogenase [Candidatus Jingweiarchaeum tengchongense]